MAFEVRPSNRQGALCAQEKTFCHESLQIPKWESEEKKHPSGSDFSHPLQNFLTESIVSLPPRGRRASAPIAVKLRATHMPPVFAPSYNNNTTSTTSTSVVRGEGEVQSRAAPAYGITVECGFSIILVPANLIRLMQISV